MLTGGFRPELMRSRVLELNASDERGISVVRDKIKSFARAAVSAPNPDYPSPPYKIVILDEADSMTQDAQGALRRIMEQYSRITRFCLVCNYVTRIIEPVASRCSKFRFRPLDVASTEARLLHIAQMEGLRLNPDLVPVLIRSSEGDMRRSITYLQSIARLASARGGDVRDMSPTTVSELAGAVPKDVIQSLARAIGIDSDDINDELPPRATGSTDFDVIERAVRHVVREGYSSLQVVLQVRSVPILVSFYSHISYMTILSRIRSSLPSEKRNALFTWVRQTSLSWTAARKVFNCWHCAWPSTRML